MNARQKKKFKKKCGYKKWFVVKMLSKIRKAVMSVTREEFYRFDDANDIKAYEKMLKKDRNSILSR